jgi:uncharacterized protein (TIGR00251 family)
MEAGIEIVENAGGVTFPVRLHPRAGRERLAGTIAGRLKIEVTPGPVNNQANRALVGLLRKEFKVPRNAVTIVRGASSRDKLIRIRGVTAEKLAQILRGKIA